MSDIVERLRGLADCDARAGEPLGRCMRDAATEIERLRSRLKEAQRRGNIISDAIYYAIEVSDDCANWLSDWFHGEPDAMRDLELWRKKTGRAKDE